MARRVNTKFLIILSIVVVGAAAAALMAGTFLLREDPQAIADAGREAAKAGNDEQALRHFEQALSLTPKDAALWVARGDAYDRLAARDPDHLTKARASWHHALEVDPNHRDALERLAHFYYDAIPMGGSDLVRVAQEGRTFAERLAAVATDDARAQALPHLFTLRAWLLNVTAEDETVEASVAALRELSAKDPSDARVPHVLALVSVRRAQDALRRNDPQDAQRLYFDAATTLDGALAARPDDIELHALAARVYRALVIAWKPGNADDAEREGVMSRLQAHIDRALAASEPSDPHHVELHLEAARIALARRDVAGAIQRLRDLYAVAPNERPVQLELARLLLRSRTDLDQALAILERPVEEKASGGLDAWRRAASAVEAQLLRADVRLELASDRAEGRDELITAAQTDITAAAAKAGEQNPHVLRLRGKVHWIKGESVPAIQSLSRAVELLEGEPEAEREMYSAMDLLARAYIATGQTGQAKALLERIVARAPDYLPSRGLLATVLLRERDRAAAQRHIDVLAEAAPDEPEVIKLQIAARDPNDKDDLRRLIERLPEETTDQQLDKAAAASKVGLVDEAERLLSAVLAADAQHMRATILLSQLYASQGRRDEAAALIERVTTARGGNAGLELLRKQLAGASADELREARTDLVEQTNDPASREVLLAGIAAAEGRTDEALRHLLSAETHRPDDKLVLGTIFDHALQQGDWERAEQYARKLADLNADDAHGALLRHRLLLARGEAEQAVTVARQLTQELPQFAQSWVALGQAQQASNRHGEAIHSYRAALDRQPLNLDALRGLVDCHLASKQPAEAKQYIDRGLALAPQHPYFKQVQVEYELAHGDPERALGSLRRTAQGKPEDAAAALDLARACLVAGNSAIERDDRQTAQKRYTEALDAARAALTHHPDQSALAGLAAEAALRLGRAADAEAVLTALASRDAWTNRPEPQLMLAEAYTRAGRPADAEKVLRGAVERFPERTDVRMRLVDLFTLLGRSSDALATLKTGGDDPAIVRRRIELQLNLDLIDDAERDLATALASAPEAIDLISLSARAQLARGRWDDATATLEKILRLRPDDQAATRNLAQVKLRQPQPDIDAAIALLSAARDRDPSNVELRATLAQSYARRGQPDKAIEELDAALRLRPENKGLRLALVDLQSAQSPPRWLDVERTLREGLAIDALKEDPDLLRAEASMWMVRNDVARARDSITRAAKVAPNDVLVATTHLNVLLRQDDRAALKAEAERLLSVNPDLWWAHQARAIALQRSGDAAGASASFRAALDRAIAQKDGPASLEIVNAMAREAGAPAALALIEPLLDAEGRWKLLAADLHALSGDMDTAVAMVESALRATEPVPADRATALRLLTNLHLKRHTDESLAQAVRAYEQLLQIEPDDVPALNNMAWLLSEGLSQPRLDEALGYSRRAYDIMRSGNRPDPIILDTHGWLLVQTDATDEGLALLQEAVVLGALPETRYHLGEAYLKKQDPQQARRELDLALEQVAQIEQAGQPVAKTLHERIRAARDRADQQINGGNGGGDGSAQAE